MRFGSRLGFIFGGSVLRADASTERVGSEFFCASKTRVSRELIEMIGSSSTITNSHQKETSQFELLLLNWDQFETIVASITYGF